MHSLERDDLRPAVGPRLRFIRDAGVPVAAVLDVGVQSGTEFLCANFPHVPHALFDPIDSYFAAVRDCYAGVPYELFQMALSDEDGVAWQVSESRDGSGRVTHSFLSDVERTPSAGSDIVECKQVRKMRLDTWLADTLLAGPYLLKVDVDGHEIPILNGAVKTLRESSVVIVEASIATVRAKLNLLEPLGFQLLDIVDLCYYHGVLSQVDLIFVRAEWVQKCADLRPWQSKAFTWSAWKKFQ